ncbi:MAG: lytic transglycosylase domain-containing protein [Novosphingobium pentaromativorans]|uniref:Lytic transglycosylase domain-containing protein n=1 Tax=Novosphingobium pentaromativorans TaxID=205844 RepID=A0A2W5NF77_9SPHN|nr:MAG: lytic transglycosylase domain-containing protein [Novosphingobium pentaromativorans]
MFLSGADPAFANEQGGVGRWRKEIAEASARFDIPAVWIERVMAAESRGRTMRNGRPITSPAGAMGLMQVMPRTWAELRSRLGLGSDPHAPRDNILAGTAYLREMYDRFGYPGMFAAYNAGPKRYAASLASVRPLPAETRAYLVEVTVKASEPGTVYGAGTRRQTIFVALRQPRSFFVVASDQTAPAAPFSAKSTLDAASGNPYSVPSFDPLFAVRAVR